jgi:putative membrane protein
VITAFVTDPAVVDVVSSHRWHRGGGWFPWFPLVPLFVVGVWVLLITLVFRRRWGWAPGRSAEDVLAERYARGEIDEAELRERRAVLRRKD